MTKKKLKTLTDWEENHSDKELTEYLQPLDEIDEQMYWRIACGFMAAKYQHGGLIQGGDPNEEISEACYTYATVNEINGKFYYLGELPEFKAYPYEHD